MTHDRESPYYLEQQKRGEELEERIDDFRGQKASEQIDIIIEMVGEDSVAETLFELHQDKLRDRWAEPN